MTARGRGYIMAGMVLGFIGFVLALFSAPRWTGAAFMANLWLWIAGTWILTKPTVRP